MSGVSAYTVLAALLPDGWRAAAACKDVDPETFFPVGEGTAARYQTVAAKRICAGCPVLDACHTWVLTHPQTDGIYAGLTPNERRSAYKPRAVAPFCRHGHERTEHNFYRRVDGKAECRLCRNIRAASDRAAAHERKHDMAVMS